MRGVEKLVPELRFSGFDNQWSRKRFNDVLILKSRPFKMDDESEYSLVTVKRRYGGVIARGIYKGQEIKVKSQFKLKENDFIISKRQIVHNACGIVPKNLNSSIVSNEYSVFKPKSNLDIAYFNYFCHLPKISHTFYLSSIGVHIEKMLFKVDDWLKWQFCFPALPEQKKIASFLSAVDKKIEKLTRKKELLEKYKKGVMQKVFSYQIRFDSVNDEGNSIRRGRIKDFGHFYYGKSAPKWSIQADAKTPCIRYGELYSTYREKIDKVHSYTNIPKEKLKFSKGGEVLVPRVGENPLDFAKCSYLPFQNVAIGEMISVYNTSENGLFLTYYFNAMMIKKFARVVEGANVSNLYFRYLEEIEIQIPSIKEQDKIVSFLVGIDKKIKAVQTQLTQTQEFKKGLLQKMFV